MKKLVRTLRTDDIDRMAQQAEYEAQRPRVGVPHERQSARHVPRDQQQFRSEWLQYLSDNDIDALSGE